MRRTVAKQSYVLDVHDIVIIFLGTTKTVAAAASKENEKVEIGAAALSLSLLSVEEDGESDDLISNLDGQGERLVNANYSRRKRGRKGLLVDWKRKCFKSLLVHKVSSTVHKSFL